MKEIFSVEILKLDEPTITGRIYPREVVEKSFYQDREYLGRIGMPEYGVDSNSGEINLRFCSHITKNLRIEDNVLKCDIKILDTKHGHILENLIGYGIFRTAGYGNVKDKVVQDDFKITSINFVENENV